MDAEVEALLAEAQSLNECAKLVRSVADQVASLATKIHTMSECADETVALLSGWTGKQFLT